MLADPAAAVIDSQTRFILTFMHPSAYACLHVYGCLYMEKLEADGRNPGNLLRGRNSLQTQ